MTLGGEGEACKNENPAKGLVTGQDSPQSLERIQVSRQQQLWRAKEEAPIHGRL